MRLLFEMDKHDHDDCTGNFVRNSARSIIIKDEKVAMIRETREEEGIVVKPETIKEYGKVHRAQRSSTNPSECFIQDNYYYLCDAESEIVPQCLDDYEEKESYTLEFVDPTVIIQKNRNVLNSPYDNMMFEREARVIEMLIDEGLLHLKQ